MTDLARQRFSMEDQEWVDRFLAQTTLFLGPDPEIMTDHRMAPRTAEEERLLAGPIDTNALDRVRKRIIAGLDEAFEMMEQTGAAPGAKWGDLTSAVYSASGDLIHQYRWGVGLRVGAPLPRSLHQQILDTGSDRRSARR